MRILFSLLLALAVVTTASAKVNKPQWVGNTPKELNRTYRLVEVVSCASTIEGARALALEKLAGDRLLTEGVSISQKTEAKTNKQKTRVGNQPLQQTSNTYTTVNTIIDGSPIELSALRVDEYVVYENGMVTLHTLFQVATCQEPIFDNVYVTDKYGFSARALAPGWAQIYKGSMGKGISIIVAEAAAIGSIIYTESMRATYISKMYSQPNFAKEYKSRADNFEIARNCCIGVAAAIYVYNLIDAIVAPGARRVVLMPRNLHITPTASSDFAGVAVSYTF